MNFYHNLITEKSFELLKELNKKFKFILIGDWAVFFYTQALKSKDIDIIIEYEELAKFKQEFIVTKNERLKKYEVKQEEIDIDIYLPFYSNPGLPAEVIKNYTTSQEGFILAIPEVLLILKQEVFKKRRNSPKGEKDKLDIFSLLNSTEIDWKLYQKILDKYNQKSKKNELIQLLKTTYEGKEIGLNRQKISGLKKKILKALNQVKKS